LNSRPAGEKILKAGRYIQLLVCDTWEYVRRANCSGIVIILAVTEKKHVIFVEQYRVPVGGVVIELPAGLANDRPGKKNETLAAAAKRELWEETGYRASRMVKLTEGPAASGSSSDIIVFFKAEGLRKTGRGGGDATETITVHEIPLPDVTSWLEMKRRQGLHIDPKIYTGLYFLNLYNNPQ
jgi:ADP-ribose pyrophosphatase